MKSKKLNSYLIAEIREKNNELNTQQIFVDKILLALSATCGGVSIALFGTVFGSVDQITSESLSLVFSISNEIAKKLQKAMRKKKKKDIKILLLARNKSNSIENLISKALIHNEISYGEFNTIMNKEKV